jgi:hypothetical protein
LHRSWREAKPFYGSFTALVVLAAGITLIPNAPLGLITTAVQALAGLLLPSASLFLLLLCNDREVLGPWINRPWLNALATVILGVLLMLSLILVATTIFPGIDVGLLVLVLSCVLGVVLVGLAMYTGRAGGLRPPPVDRRDRETWRMPQAVLLSPPAPSRARRVALLALSSYLVVAVAMLLVKAVQIATAH